MMIFAVFDLPIRVMPSSAVLLPMKSWMLTMTAASACFDALARRRVAE